MAIERERDAARPAPPFVGAVAPRCLALPPPCALLVPLLAPLLVRFWPLLVLFWPSSLRFELRSISGEPSVAGPAEAASWSASTYACASFALRFAGAASPFMVRGIRGACGRRSPLGDVSFTCSLGVPWAARRRTLPVTLEGTSVAFVLMPSIAFSPRSSGLACSPGSEGANAMHGRCSSVGDVAVMTAVPLRSASSASTGRSS